MKGVQPNGMALGESSSFWTEFSLENGGSDDTYLAGLFGEFSEAKANNALDLAKAQSTLAVADIIHVVLLAVKHPPRNWHSDVRAPAALRIKRTA